MPKFEVIIFKSNEKFAEEIRNEKENINCEMFKEFSEYQSPSFLAKD